MKLLLVADADWVETRVKSVLPHGWELVRQDDPRLAVATVNQEGPDAVAVDMQVGSMGGMAVVRAIRDAAAIERARPVHLILLLDREADRFIARRAGADYAVVKPFEATEFRAGLPVVESQA
ncbi:MAG TPA: response regulator [Acidimicrobiia bacterium]|jgi:DNA-binding response OmpR family regulator